MEKHPNVNYYIYEPIPEILHTYLSHKSLKRLPSLRLKDIILADNELEIRRFLNHIIDKTKDDFIYITLNSHKNVYEEEYNEFIEIFKEILKDKKKPALEQI